jgi:hypothetical protein
LLCCKGTRLIGEDESHGRTNQEQEKTEKLSATTHFIDQNSPKKSENQALTRHINLLEPFNADTAVAQKPCPDLVFSYLKKT